MAQPYVGEIRMFAGNFAPREWAFCQGQLLPISQYATLFNLIGTTYGGDGQTTFALPDLRGRSPVHQGQGAGLSSYIIGQLGGAETVTLLTTQLPAHTHVAACQSGAGTSSIPANNLWAASAATRQYTNAGTFAAALNSGSVGLTGGSLPHNNLAPYLVINFIISLFGIFPSRS